MHSISTQKENQPRLSLDKPITPKSKRSPSTPKTPSNDKKPDSPDSATKIVKKEEKPKKPQSKLSKLMHFLTVSFYVVTALLLSGFLINNTVLAFEKSSVLTKPQGKMLTKFSSDLPQPTLLVDGTNIHAICFDNSPKDKNMFVFFEPAEAGFSLSATTLIQELSKHFKVCTYDRLGKGFSTISPSLAKNWTAEVDSVDNKHKLEMKYFQPIDVILSQISTQFSNIVPESKPEVVLIGNGFGANLLAGYISSRAEKTHLPVVLKKAFFIDPIPSNYTMIEGKSRILPGKISQKSIDSILKEFGWYKKKATMIGSFMAITGILRLQTLLPFKAIPHSVLSTTSISKAELTPLEDEVIETKFHGLKQEQLLKKNRRILNMVLNDQRTWDSSFQDLNYLPILANYTTNEKKNNFPVVKLLLTRNYDRKNFKVSKLWEEKICDAKSQERVFLLPFADSDIEIFSSNSKVGDLEQYSSNILKSLFLS